MPASTYALLWDRAVFEAEALRIADLSDSKIVPATELLLEEAYSGPIAANEFREELFGPPTFSKSEFGLAKDARRWLRALINDEDRLRPYRRPAYFIERSTSAPKEGAGDIAVDWMQLIDELQSLDYFPDVMPHLCIDDNETDPPDARQVISDAIGVKVDWPIDANVAWLYLEEPVLFSLIEYFHDEAKRPRARTGHDYGDCGFHFHDHNSAAGQALYRSRVNRLLELHSVNYRLSGDDSPEPGRLHRVTGTPLDELADKMVADRQAGPADDIGQAILDFRRRDANTTTKRHALGALARAMEYRRPAIKEALTKKDELHLFEIANNFDIRHSNTRQRVDYGDEFLDWIFWNFLAAVDLVDRIEHRENENEAD